MNKLLLAAAAAATLIAAAPAASAATQILNFTLSADGNSAAASFNNTGTGTTFSDLYTFTLPAGFISTSLTTAAAGSGTDVTFTSVLLNSQVLTTNATGTLDSKSLLNVPVVGGSHSLTVNGTSGGIYSYGGNVSFARAVAGVPEPASWALLITGFGGVGAVLRGKRRQSFARLAA